MKSTLRKLGVVFMAVLICACATPQGTITKGLIGAQDVQFWDGSDAGKSFSRATSVGGTMTLQTLGYEVDALIKYGGGVAYTQATIQAALTAIGTTSNVTLILRPGSWTISSPLSIPANVTLAPAEGATFSFSGTGAVTGLKKSRPQWFGFSSFATGAVNSAAFTAAAAATSGGILEVTPGSYTLAGNVTISNALTVHAYGATFSWASDTTANRGFLVTSSNVEIYGLKLDGPQHASQVNTQVGIYAYGADASNYIAGLKLKHCKITDFSYGIQGAFVRDFDISENDVYDVFSVGISLASASNGRIVKNRVKDIAGTAGGVAYGIAVTRTAGAIATYPRSADVIVALNDVSGVAKWEGIDTHSGQRVVISQNTVKNCLLGIMAGPSGDENGDTMFAPLEVSIEGNTVDSGVTDGTAHAGIGVVGAFESPTVNEYATGSIVGNIVKGHGRHSSLTDGEILAYFTRGLKVSENLIIEPAPTGIHIYQYNDGFSITGNTIIDAWGTGATGIAIYANDGNNSGYIGGNSFILGTKTATSVLAIGIKIDSNATDDITIGENYSEATKYLAGTLTYVSFGTKDGGNFLFKQVFPYTDYLQSTVGPVKDWSFVFPAGTVFTDVWWRLDTEFSGGAVSAATMKMGVSGGDTAGFFPAENVFTGAGAGYKDSTIASRGGLLYDATAGNTMPLNYFCAAACNLRTTMALTTDTGDHLTAGQMTVWVRGYRVK